MAEVLDIAGRRLHGLPAGVLTDRRLSAGARDLAQVLATCTDRGGVAAVTVFRLAERTGVCERTVQRQLAELEGAGWITREVLRNRINVVTLHQEPSHG